MKKFLFVFMLLFLSIITSGCDLFSKNTDLKEVKYEDLDNIYNKTYYDLLPSSVYNENLVNKYQENNVFDMATDIINDEYEEPEIPSIEEFYPQEISPSDVTDLTFETLYQNVGITGPVDIVYSNIASVQYMLQLLQKMNEEFGKNGDIVFDGTEITIPGTDLPDIKDPLNPGENIHFNDITAKYTTKDKVSHIFVHTENGYSYDEYGIGSFTGEIGLYLHVTISMTKDDVATITMDFYLTCDLSVEGELSETEANDTASINYKIGQSIKAIDNKSLIINNQVETNLNVQLANNDFLGEEIPDIDESNAVKSSFVLTKNNDNVVANYKLISNGFTEGSLNYRFTADSEGSIFYLDGALSDKDFYGFNIPAQALKGVFVYDENSKLIFVGGDVALNIPEYSMGGTFMDTTSYNYAGYAWNLDDLSGWTKIAKTTNPEYPDEYDLYNGNNILLSVLDQQGTFDEYDELIEGKAIAATNVSVDGKDNNLAFFVHGKKGNSINIDLPDGLTSLHENMVIDLFSDLTNIQEDIDINFEKAKHQVPILDKDLY